MVVWYGLSIGLAAVRPEVRAVAAARLSVPR